MMFEPFDSWYADREAALQAARDRGFTLFARRSDFDREFPLIDSMFAVKTYGAVGHAAGAHDQMFVLVVHRNTGYADWRAIPVYD